MTRDRRLAGTLSSIVPGLALALALNSCASAPLPPSGEAEFVERTQDPAGPVNPVGFYIGLFPRGKNPHGDLKRAELRLFETGDAFLRLEWTGEGEVRGEAGGFRFNRESEKLWVIFATGAISGGFAAEISCNPPVFVADGIAFVRVRREPAIFPVDLAGSAGMAAGGPAGDWVRQYDSGGVTVRVTLSLDGRGGFVETIDYGDGENPIRESGTCVLRGSSGLVDFHFSDLPGAGFTGFLDMGRKALTAPDGEYRLRNSSVPMAAAPPGTVIRVPEP